MMNLRNGEHPACFQGIGMGTGSRKELGMFMKGETQGLCGVGCRNPHMENCIELKTHKTARKSE
jgi:hypothetical protein